MKTCPNCGEQIPHNAIRCKYCKTMLKTYSNNKSTEPTIKSTNTTDSNDKPQPNTENKTPEDKKVLDDNLIKIIEENLDDVCRIFSIPKLGKKFVINKLTSEYSQEEISEKLKKYINPNKESSISKRYLYKKELMDTKINPIPEEHFKIYFIINRLSFKSKKEFIEHMKTYWGPDEIKEFYEEYTSLLKYGIQEKDFEKVLESDIEETCKIFSISNSMRRLGKRFVVNRILNKFTVAEIKDKLNNKFKLSDKYLNEEIPKKTENEIKYEETKPPEISKPNYYNYKTQTNRFKSQFDKKEKEVRGLIEKCFPAPQMTNSKFNATVDECSRVFDQKVKSIMTILESTNEYSDKLKKEIESDIEILKEINVKLDLLYDELLIIQSESDNGDVEILLDEMDNLIKSVNEYKH